MPARWIAAATRSLRRLHWISRCCWLSVMATKHDTRANDLVSCVSRFWPIFLSIVVAVGFAADATAARTQQQLWKALGGKVECGPTVPSPNGTAPLLCQSRAVPAPSDPGVGDPGFVYLKRTGRPIPARLSQYTWAVSEPPVTLKAGRTWTGHGVTCSIRVKSVRCSNRSHHGFKITRGSYRAF
jgi:hypothetical protein